jgi:hypothetical protein
MIRENLPFALAPTSGNRERFGFFGLLFLAEGIEGG